MVLSKETGFSTFAKNRPVWDAVTLATCSGRPSATIWPTGGAAFGAEVDDPVG